MSLITEIADAVTAELNAAPNGTFSQTFTAQRKVLPVYELSDLSELKVTVVPKAVEISGSTRSASQYDFNIDIGIQQKLTSASGSSDLDAEVATLGTLVDEINDYLRKRSLGSFAGGHATATVRLGSRRANARATRPTCECSCKRMSYTPAAPCSIRCVRPARAPVAASCGRRPATSRRIVRSDGGQNLHFTRATRIDRMRR